MDQVGLGTRDDTRFHDEPGFRTEPEFRGPEPYRPTGHGRDQGGGDPPAGRRPVDRAALDDVFDDPEHGDPGRDRMAVHALWEMLLLLGVAGLAYLLWRWEPDMLRGEGLNELLAFGAALGLLALGAGLTLRAAVPNLAIGPASVAAALFYAENGDQGVITTTAVIAGAALVVGLVTAVLVVGFHVPGWAASLVAALGIIVWIQQQGSSIPVSGGYDPTRHSLYLFGAFAALAVLGGLFGSIKTLRRLVGRFRPTGDPARRRGAAAATVAAGSLMLSMVFAAVGGVLFAAVGDEPVAASIGLDLTGLALGAAMAGGTSAFGRRGGIFGTLLTVSILTLLVALDEAENLRISVFAMAGTAMLIGLVVTRVVETFGLPASVRQREDDDDWEGTPPSRLGEASATWGPSRLQAQESWSSPLPAQPSATSTDLWDNDRWGQGSR